MLTGKGLEYGGSLIRTEATGYGAVYFLENMLSRNKNGFVGKKCLVSGSGNVAHHAAEKLIQLGAKVLTLSDSDGFIHDPDGITAEKLARVMDIKNNKRGRIEEAAKINRLRIFRRQAPVGRALRRRAALRHAERNQRR